MAKTNPMSFRFDEKTQYKLSVLSEWLTLSKSAILEEQVSLLYLDIRAKRLMAGLPVDDLTPQEGGD